MSVFGKVAFQRTLIAGMALVLASPAFGAILNPDDTQTRPSLPGTNYTLGRANLDTDYTLFATNIAPHMAGSQLDGITTSRIYRNIFDGTLAFSYVVDANVSNGTYITGADMDGVTWNGVTILNAGADNVVNVGTSGSGDVPEWGDGTPYSITRANPPSPASPKSPAWSFKSGSIGTVIGPTNSSAEIWFTTNAKSYTTAFIAYLGQGSVGRAEVYVPVIPDPATLALLGLGASGLAMFRRRRTA